MSSETAAESRGFSTFGLDPRLVEGLTGLGYEEPTAVQQQAIPPLLEGHDLVGQAATGTGKTAAFALPLLQRLAAEPRRSRHPSALVMVPTRELAMQVAEAIHRYGRALGVEVLPIFGGQPFHTQLRALHRGVDVIVGTPGRIVDHLRRETLSLAELQVVVLDEADEMLDMGFAEDLETILSAAPEERQTILFSATMPARIAAIAKQHLRKPLNLRIAAERPKTGVAPKVRQRVYVVSRSQKIAALGRILDMEDPGATIVFCRTRNEVDELGEKLQAHGYRAEVLHGGMSQEQRDRVMQKLRREEADLLIATDVAARGLDIAQLTHVINYDVPSAPESYVHRIGRVGRAGREGVAITLAEPREQRLMRNIEQLTKQRLEIASVPTVADLRAKRLEAIGASLAETLLEGGFEPFRAVIDGLNDFEPADVAMAAVKLLFESAGAASETEIAPPPPPKRERGAMRSDDEKPRHRARPGFAGHNSGGMVRLFIGGGREMGLRPQDIVGAITGEAGISGREVGVITISERFSLAEVADEVADDVIAALRSCAIKGRRVTVRREHAGAPPPARGHDDRRPSPRPHRKGTGRRS